MLQRTEISSLQYSITLEIQELLAYLCRLQMVVVAQLVRAPGCGPGGRGFKTPQPPHFPRLRCARAQTAVFAGLS